MLARRPMHRFGHVKTTAPTCSGDIRGGADNNGVIMSFAVDLHDMC